ncbi:PREDICTED: X-linked retinitis pigmentosa GTPase regulator isoform X2 [Tarenaya hassleriana]|uniref:X-linked retinitis pigmentosa GTPase regulator isoform X2 n=1 Tax=Tarenaya hassleriana TaxID=28532 RepID=UPI00053C1BED|nr:PREDICTED: X-linked retinitis pigmentosa GTPase regulator isoform X2 [Tarenaya hassleriana]
MIITLRKRVLYGASIGIDWWFSALLLITISASDTEEIGMACFQKSPTTDRENDQAIAILKKGAYLLKYGRRGKPKFYPFRLSSDETVLLWYCGKKEKRLKLSSVSKIIPGQRTVCKDRDEAEFWITTIRALLSRRKSSQLINHSRNLSFFPGNDLSYSNSVSNLSSASSEISYKEVGETERAFSRSCKSTPPRLGKVFSDVLSQTAVVRAFSSEGFGEKPNHSLPDNHENPPSRSSEVDAGKSSFSSSVISSGSGQVSCHEDSLCDVFVWGEGFGNGVSSSDGMSRAGGSSYGSMSDLFSPKVLNSHVALDAHALSCGSKYMALVTKHGQMYSWGEESGGRLGHGISSDIPQPKLIDELEGSSIEFADCGEFHTCAVTVTGDLYAWGDGIHNLGLLGLGNEASHWKPVRILGEMEGIHVRSVSCGSWHTAVVTLDGRLFTFGDGAFGALGHGDRSSTSIPREVEALKGCRTVKTSCGVWHSAAIVEISASDSSLSGRLFTWGDGEKGKLGHDNEESKLVPSSVTAVETTSFRQVACGQSVTVALSESGRVYITGTADPSLEKIIKVPACVVDGIGKSLVEEVTCGLRHIAVLNSKTEVYTWGKGSNGQLGHGDTEDRGIPTLVKALKGKQVKRIVCGSNFTAAICLHKPISCKDSSRCSSCRNPFNYLRKPHNCYNCGSIFCNSCTSKKSLAAAMAPKVQKPFRVCDDCYEKLEGVRESEGFPPGNLRRSNASIHSSSNDIDEKESLGGKPQRQLLRLDSFDFFRQAKSPELKHVGEASRVSHWMMKSSSSETDIKGVKGVRRLSRLTSFDSFKQEGGRQRSKHYASKSDTSSLVRHSVAATQRASAELLFPLSVKSSPVYSAATTSDYYTDLPDPELPQDGSKKRNHCLNQEIAVLKAQVEDLTQKTKQLETELGTSSKKLEIAMLVAREETEKNRSSKEAIRSLTLQLMEATKKEADTTRRRRISF